MKKQSMFSRLFAVLMAVLMVCTVVPAASFSYAAAAKTSTSATAAKMAANAISENIIVFCFIDCVPSIS